MFPAAAVFPFLIAAIVPTGIWHILRGLLLFSGIFFLPPPPPHSSNDIFIPLHRSFLTVLQRRGATESDWSSGRSYQTFALSLNTHATILLLPSALSPSSIFLIWAVNEHKNEQFLHSHTRTHAHQTLVQFLVDNHTLVLQFYFIFLHTHTHTKKDDNTQMRHSLSHVASTCSLVIPQLFTSSPQDAFLML